MVSGKDKEQAWRLVKAEQLEAKIDDLEGQVSILEQTVLAMQTSITTLIGDLEVLNSKK